jgi:hypothetical protein
MSHCPGDTLEDFLTDLFALVVREGTMGDAIRRLYAGQRILSAAQLAELAVIFEPYRGDVERYLEEFDDDEHGSWRDFRNFVLCPLFDSDHVKQAEALLDSWKLPQSRGLVS